MACWRDHERTARSLRSKYNAERSEGRKEKLRQSSEVMMSMRTHESLTHFSCSRTVSGLGPTNQKAPLFQFDAPKLPTVGFRPCCTRLHRCSACSSSTFHPLFFSSSDINFHILFPQQEINTACKYRSFALFFFFFKGALKHVSSAQKYPSTPANILLFVKKKKKKFVCLSPASKRNLSFFPVFLLTCCFFSPLIRVSLSGRRRKTEAQRWKERSQ